MKKSKFLRLIALLLACAFPIFALAACTDGEPPDGEGNRPSSGHASKRVAFTFDDGPTPGVTEKILDKLEEIDGRVTFFQVANRHNYVSDAVYGRIEELGCEIGSHTFSHPNSFSELSMKATKEQLEKSVSDIEGEISGKVTLFRPVGGESTYDQRAKAAEMGLHTIYWSLDTEDWREQTNDLESVEEFIDEKVNYIVNNAEDGDIILMHELYLSSYEIFSRAADELTERGFELVTVSEILGFGKNTKPSAKVHVKGEPMFSEDAVG